jgi:hypothetical protein
MRINLVSFCAVIGAFGLAGLAQSASSAGGAAGGGGHGGGVAGGHAGGAATHGSAGHGGAVHDGVGLASTPLGSRIPTGLETRGDPTLAKMGFAGAYADRIDGHNATVAVFHRAPLTAAERDRIHHYHFKGFNECAGHGACAEAKRGEEIYCRRASSVAITNDLECLSFRSE